MPELPLSFTLHAESAYGYMTKVTGDGELGPGAETFGHKSAKAPEKQPSGRDATSAGELKRPRTL
jgi:hypothetical protein